MSMGENITKTLYLCYFGLREPLVQTQVLSYLREITKGDVDVSILTFEPDPKRNWTAEQIKAEKQKLASEGIEWNFLTYHKRPSLPGTFYDVIAGAVYAFRFVKRNNTNVLHARTHIPVLMAILVKFFTNIKIIFDIRGLIAEEYIDAGVWKENSLQVRLIKYVEKLGLKHSDQIVVLTDRMKNYLVENKLKEPENIEVVPCCVNFSRIGDLDDQKENRFELIYAGSTIGLYLLREMGQFFIELKKHKPDAFFRILTASPAEGLLKTFGDLNIKPEDFSVQKVSPAEVPIYLKKAHIGISFRKPTFSQIAASPTKIPEYLACGLPVISNFGIGDMDEILETENVGICVRGFEKSQLGSAVAEVLEILEKDEISKKCRQVAQKYFDLNVVGKAQYLAVYEKIK
jgi:glycosyltransferase involved in cell wall biosynthesis